MGSSVGFRFREGYGELAAGVATDHAQAGDVGRADGPFMVALLRKTNWELALQNLERFVSARGDVVCPMAIKSIKPRHRKSTALIEQKTPLYLGYVFFRCPPGVDWRHAVLLDGIVTVLRAENRPLLVPALAVSRLAPMERVALDWEHRFVEFVEGPLTGYWGEYVGGAVEIEMFGRRTRVNTHPVCLKRR